MEEIKTKALRIKEVLNLYHDEVQLGPYLITVGDVRTLANAVLALDVIVELPIGEER